MLKISEVGIIFSHFTYRKKEGHLYDYVVEVNMKAVFFTPSHHFSSTPQ